MAAKQVLFREAARQKILSGATQLADAVRVTLGPKSKSILIGRRWGAPVVCNDGVTIAKEFELKDPDENLGAQMLRQAAEKTGELVGDGTSTATLLAHTILAEGIRNVVAGASAVEIKRGLERGVAAAVDCLKALSKPVTSKAEKAQVATISAHNDPVIGGYVADAIEKVGGEGVIAVEESRTIETEVVVVDGLRFDRGYVSPYFVTSTDRPEAVLEECHVLIFDRRLSAVKDMLPVLEAVSKSGRPLLVIAEEIEAEALAVLIVNKLNGVLRACAVKAPGFGDRRRELLEDIAAITGGRLISEELGLKLENVTLEHLGSARRIVVTKDDTTIIGGHGDAARIQARAAQVRQALKDETSEYDKEKLRERLGKLVGGVAIIRVGAPSEAEAKARKEALDDAISATKAAVAEGIVPGGGLAHLLCAAVVEAEAAKCSGDERTGVLILRRALETPARQIAQNSAADGGVAVAEMLKAQGTRGFDAARGCFVDLMEAGIVDATKVVRIGLTNAASIAGILLLTEGTMTEIPEPPKSPAPAGMEA